MNKTVIGLVAALVTGVAAGALAPRALSGTAARPTATLDWQNARLFNTRATLKDGGTEIAWQACGYLNAVQQDGGVTRVSEPCWTGTFTKGEADTIIKAQLAAYDGGLR